MSFSSIALMATLAALPMAQDSSTEAPRARIMSDVQVVTLGGMNDSERLDTNDDGFVDREEFSAPLARGFDRLDNDNDGRLSPEELRGPRGEGPGAGAMVLNMREGSPGIMMFGGPGGHHHGPGGRAMVFGGPDGEQNVMVFRRGGSGGEGSAVESRVEIRHVGGPDGASDLDANDDGRVTEDEFLAPLRETFQHMDADGDGSLEDGERPGHDR